MLSDKQNRCCGGSLNRELWGVAVLALRILRNACLTTFRLVWHLTSSTH